MLARASLFRPGTGTRDHYEGAIDMPVVDVYNLDNKKVGTVDLDADVFDVRCVSTSSTRL